MENKDILVYWKQSLELGKGGHGYGETKTSFNSAWIIYPSIGTKEFLSIIDVNQEILFS